MHSIQNEDPAGSYAAGLHDGTTICAEEIIKNLVEA